MCSINLSPSVLARLFTGTAIAQIQLLDTHNSTVGDVPLQTVSESMSPNPRAWVVRNLERAANGAVDFKVWKWDFSYLPFNATIYGENHHSAELRFVAPGTYRLKLRVLKVFGSRINANDEEEWIFPYVRVIQAVSRTDNAEEKTS